LGLVNYYVREEGVFVLFIEVLTEYRWAGIGTKLVEYLVKRHQDVKFYFCPGSTLGELFWAKLIDKRILPKGSSVVDLGDKYEYKD
jgi:GNAT superfamily N-acetyltransferase